MAQTTEPYDGNGTRGSAGNALSFTFPYLKLTDVKVALNGSTLATTKYTFPTATTLQFNTGSETTLQETTGAPKTGVSILIYRDTNVDSARHVFGQGSAFKSKDLNENKEQSLYFDQEVGDTTNPKNFVTSAQISDGTSLSAADKTKLDTIEANAKDDQTGAEIKTLYEAESNTNAFTDAEKTKLGNVEANAKDDQTAAEIKSLYESNSQTNAFTDAEKTKLQSVEANAKDDQTATEIKSLYESNSDTNAFTDNDHTKLDGIEANAINASNAAITNKLPLAGGTMTGDLTVSNTAPKIILNDTDHTKNYRLMTNSSGFKIQDGTNSNADLFTIQGSGKCLFHNDAQVNNNLTVEGNLIVNGTSTSLNTATVNVDDKNFVLLSIDSPTDALANNGGFTLRGDTDKTFQWKNNTDSWTSSEHIALPDDKKLLFGAGEDLEIFHGASGNYPNLNVIRTTNTNTLYIETAQGGIAINNRTGSGATNFENMVTITPNGAVNAYYDGVKKFETKSYGVTFSGTAESDFFKVGDSPSKFIAGAGNDLEIYHEGTDSVINNETGRLRINNNGSHIDIVADENIYLKHNTNHAIVARANAEVELFYDNSRKFETTSTGVNVGTGGDLTTHIGNCNRLAILGDGTNRALLHIRGGSPGIFFDQSGGNVSKIYQDFVDLGFYSGTPANYGTEALVIKSTSDIQIPNDNKKLQIGASQDLELYHQSGNSLIANNTGALKILSNDIQFLKEDQSEFLLRGVNNGTLRLYYDGVEKLTTVSTGIDVTGKITATGNIESNADNSEFRCGANADFKISHTGSENILRSDFPTVFRNAANNETLALLTPNGAVKLYYDNSKKFETTADGVDTFSRVRCLGGTPSFQLNSDATGSNINTRVMFGLATSSNQFINGATSNDVVLNVPKKFLLAHDSNEYMATFDPDGAAELYYDGGKKIETTSTGTQISCGPDGDGLKLQGTTNRIDIVANTNRTGAANTILELDAHWNNTPVAFIALGTGDDTTNKDDGRLRFFTKPSGGTITERLKIEPNGSVQIPADGIRLQFGASQDLQLYHQHTTSSYGGLSVIESHSMPLAFKTNRNGNTEDGMVIYPNNRVELFYDNSKKLQTTSTGATVTTTSAANGIKNITTSTSGPSGGSDGDLWFTYVA